MEIKGKLIKLIEINENHLELIMKWRNDPEVSKFLFQRKKLTLNKQKKWFENFKNDKSRKQFVILENKNLMPIGVINLMNIDFENLHSDWGFYIGEKTFKMGGYAVEAEYLILKYGFEKLKLNKIYCRTLSENVKVIQVHSKLGFKTDGILREHFKGKNKFMDVTIQSILSKEFLQVKTKIENLINFFVR